MPHPSRALVLGLTALALAACGPGGKHPGANVVLISIDTLRADHLSLYGYPRPTSPFLEALAGGDVHLGAGSALLSAVSCAVAPSVDFDGESRPVGGGCEIGADEFSIQGLIFRDGFESGDTSQWTSTVP